MREEGTMKLKLSELASLAEIVGAIAVVISLVYVGAQVRDTTRAVRSAAINDANITLQSWYELMSGDAQGINVFLEAATSTEPLSREEEFRYMMQSMAFFYAIQNVYLLGREGSLDDDTAAALTAGIQATRNTPGFDRFWSQRRWYFKPEFVEFVEQIRAMPEAPLDNLPEYQPRVIGQ
jgi:hypothetical protein